MHQCRVIKKVWNQVNFIYYNSSKCVRACDLFKDYIDIVYKLKKKDISGSKIRHIIFLERCGVDWQNVQKYVVTIYD